MIGIKRLGRAAGLADQRKSKRKALDLVMADASLSNLLPIAKLYGFTEEPPKPGDAAAWATRDWVQWCNGQNMKDQEKVKHGTKLSHYNFPWLCVVPSESGDYRAAMNCAADFRKEWVRTFSSVYLTILRLVQVCYDDNVVIDGAVPDIQDVVSYAVEFGEEDDKALDGMGVPRRADLTKEQESEVNVVVAYSAMTYVARSREPQMSYGKAIVEAIRNTNCGVGVPDLEDADGIARLLGELKRKGEDKTMLPEGVAAGLHAVINYADVLRSDSEIAKAERAASREAARAKRLAEREAEARSAERSADDRIKGELDRARLMFVDVVGRFEHDINQLNARVAKAKEYATGLQFPEIMAQLKAQTVQTDDALQRIKILEETVDNYVGSMQAIAELLGIDPGATELSTKIKDAIADNAMEADVYKQRLMDFASKVNDVITKKDFLELAKGISALMPETETLALTGGDA